MDNMNGILMIGISFALILLIAAMRSRTDLLINFIMRAVLGTLAIYFINMFLGSQGFSWHVGIGNAVPTALSGKPPMEKIIFSSC